MSDRVEDLDPDNSGTTASVMALPRNHTDTDREDLSSTEQHRDGSNALNQPDTTTTATTPTTTTAIATVAGAKDN